MPFYDEPEFSHRRTAKINSSSSSSVPLVSWEGHSDWGALLIAVPGRPVPFSGVKFMWYIPDRKSDCSFQEELTTG
jgi:hypothetical protein